MRRPSGPGVYGWSYHRERAGAAMPVLLSPLDLKGRCRESLSPFFLTVPGLRSFPRPIASHSRIVPFLNVHANDHSGIDRFASPLRRIKTADIASGIDHPSRRLASSKARARRCFDAKRRIASRLASDTHERRSRMWQS